MHSDLTIDQHGEKHKGVCFAATPYVTLLREFESSPIYGAAKNSDAALMLSLICSRPATRKFMTDEPGRHNIINRNRSASGSTCILLRESR